MKLKIHEWNIYDIVDLILSILDPTIKNNITIELLTKENYRYLKRNITQFDCDNNVLYFYNSPEESLYENLFALVHECWHIVQKEKKQDIQYTMEDRKKYNQNNESSKMCMLYKYDFESEASGYAQVFVLYYLKTIQYINNKDVSEYFEIYNKPYYIDKDDVETEEDYLNISKKLNKYYRIALKDFESKFFRNDNEVYSLLKSSINAANNIEQINWNMSYLSNNKYIARMIKIYNIIEK